MLPEKNAEREPSRTKWFNPRWCLPASQTGHALVNVVLYALQLCPKHDFLIFLEILANWTQNRTI